MIPNGKEMTWKGHHLVDTIRYGTDCFLDGKWVFNPALDEKILAWQKIEPYKEKEE